MVQHIALMMTCNEADCIEDVKYFYEMARLFNQLFLYINSRFVRGDIYGYQTIF